MPKTRVLNEVRLKNKDNTISEYKVGTVNGYYNSANGKFYEEIGHITEIEGAPNLVYADLANNDLYIYKTSTGTFVRVSSQGNADAFKFGYRNTADGRFYETEEYIVEITADPANLYIDLLTNHLYKYDVTAGAYQKLDTCEYGDLEGKPTIEGVTLVGNLDAADLGLAKATDIPSVPTPSSTSPLMDGVAAVGTQIFYAREDHVHPSDTSKYGVTDSISGTINDTDYVPMSDTNNFKRRTPWTSIINKIKGALGSAAQKDVPVSGNATTTQVVMGNDTRLEDDRNAKDVYSWAKAENKPTYTASEVGTYTTTEIDNKLAAIESGLDWKEAVATYADISTAYPNPVDGWTVNVKDTDYTYRFNGTDWITISANAIPNATTTVNGLMTTTQVNKLENIEDEAQVNVQSDWDVTDSSSDAFIKNKPTIPAAQVNADWDASSGVAQILNKPTIPAAQIQSDWAQTTTTAKDYIKNKPTLGTAAAKDIPASGNASTSQVVMGNDTRLSDDRKALDVYSWAKESTKPTYNGSEIKTNAAKTGTAQSSVTTTIAANTTIDNAVGTLLNNDVTVNTSIQNLSTAVIQQININGCKNYVSQDAGSVTKNGITFTNNGDGTYTVSGTNTSSTSAQTLYPNEATPILLKAGQKYTLSGGVNSNLALNIRTDMIGTNYFDADGHTVAAGSTAKSFTNGNSDVYVYILIRVAESATVNGTVKPMLCLKSNYDLDPTFEPYAKTNQELALENQNLTNQVNYNTENGVKNILPVTLKSMTANKVAITVNTDGTITVNSVDGEASSGLVAETIGSFTGVTDIKLSGCPSGGDSSTYCLQLKQGSSYSITDSGSGATYTCNPSLIYEVVLVIRSGQTISNKVFKPMVTLGFAPNSDYAHFQPYTLSNSALTTQANYNTNNGVKNLFKIDIDRIKNDNHTSNSSWSSNTYTYHSGTFTFTDNSITFGGTPTDNAFMYINMSADNIPPAKYILSGFSSCVNAIIGVVTLYSNDTAIKSYSLATKNNSELDFTGYTYDTIRFEIKRQTNNVAMSGTAKPMLCRKDLWDADNTYENYAESNSILTQKTIGLIDNTKTNGVVNILSSSFADGVSKGVTLTNNADGTLNVSGTNDGTGVGYFNGSYFKVSDSGLYKITGIPETIAVSRGYTLDLYLYNVTDAVNVSSSAAYIQDHIYYLDSSKTYRPVIAIYSGKTIPSGTVIKPMISLASLNLSYNDYIPYVKSNKELTGIVDPLKTQFDADHSLVDTISDTMNVYWTDNALPSDWSNLTTQQVTDIVQALYDVFKKIGGRAWIRYSGLVNTYYKKASDDSQLGSSRDMVDIYSNVSYSSMLSNNTNARFTMVRHPYGSTVQTTYALWGNKFMHSSHGINAVGDVSNFDKIYTYNTISTYKG